MTEQHLMKVEKDLEKVVNDSIAPLVEQISKWRDDVDAADTTRLKEVARALFDLATLHALLDAETKRLYHVKNMLDKTILPRMMEASGVDMVRIPEIARSFSLSSRTSASMLDKDKAFEWLRDNGHGDLIMETVNSSSLAALCRSLLLEEGVEPPAEVIKVNTYDTTNVRKYTPKAN